MSLTKIGSIGINTGIQLAGVTTIATLNASDNVLSVGGTVNFNSDVSIGGTISIGGTLTYEDVTNVDSVGLITARAGVVVGSGITLSKDGDGFFTGIVTATSFSGAISGTTIDSVGLVTARSGIEVGARPGVAASISVDGNMIVSGISTFNSRVLLGTTTEGEANADDLTIAGSGHVGITIRAGTTYQSAIYMSDATSGGGEYVGNIIYDHDDNHMRFATNEVERLRIASDGKTTYNSTGQVTAEFNTSHASAAYHDYKLGASGARIGYIGAGSQLVTTSGNTDFAIRAENNFVIGTNGNNERLRITTGGKVIVGSQGGGDSLLAVDGANSATPRIGITNPDNAENFNVSSYHDSNGIYVMLGVNSKYDANGNFATDTTAHRASAITLDARNSGSIQFHTTEAGGNASERLRIDSTGNILLNGGSLRIDGTGEFAVYESDTSLAFSNSAQISLDFSSNIARIRSTASGSGTSRPLALCIGSSEKLHISATGSVGVNQSSPDSYHSSGRNLVVGSGSGDEGITIVTGNSSDGVINFADGTSGSESYMGRILYRHGDNAMTFHTNTGAERLRIKSDGTVIVKTAGLNLENSTATNSRAYSITNAAGTTGWTFGNGVTANSHQFVIYDNTAGAARLTINSSGVVSGNLNDTSDEKLKENIVSITDGAISKIKQLRPVNFDWKKEMEVEDLKGESGFIAQEIKKVIPDLVKGTEYDENQKTGGYSVNTTGLVAYLTKALQEAITKIETLEADVAALKSN